jgi:hypothetical protein
MLSNTCDAKHRYFVAYLPTFRIFILIFCYHSDNNNILIFSKKVSRYEVAKRRRASQDIFRELRKVIEGS